MSKIRQQRTAEQIRIILSELVLRQISDPRLQGLTITDVTIDRELQYADIYVNALGDDSREDDVMAALQGAKGALLHAVSAADGRKLNELKLDGCPVFDGMAAAEGKLFISMMDGSVVCFE